MLQPGEQRGHRGFVDFPDPAGQVADLHGADLCNVLSLDPGGPGLLAEPGAFALGTGLEGDGALHEGPDVGLHRFEVLGEHRFLDLGDHALEGEVDALDLDLGRLLVEEVVQFLFAELCDRLVHVEPGAAEDAAVPAVHAVAGDREGAVFERLAVVVQRREVEVGNRAHTLAARAHAPQVNHLAHHVLLDPAALLRAHHPAGLPRRDIEGERRRRPHMRLTEPAEEDTQHRIGIRGRADGRAGVGAHPFLVDEDRRRQPVECVDVGPREGRHKALDKGAVRLVDQPLRLRGDRAEHQRALAGAGNAREHGESAFRDLDADVLEVVHARALDPDAVVAVRRVQPGRLPGRRRIRAHRVSIC